MGRVAQAALVPESLGVAACWQYSDQPSLASFDTVLAEGVAEEVLARAALQALAEERRTWHWPACLDDSTHSA